MFEATVNDLPAIQSAVNHVASHGGGFLAPEGYPGQEPLVTVFRGEDGLLRWTCQLCKDSNQQRSGSPSEGGVTSEAQAKSSKESAQDQLD